MASISSTSDKSSDSTLHLFAANLTLNVRHLHHTQAALTTQPTRGAGRPLLLVMPVVLLLAMLNGSDAPTTAAAPGDTAAVAVTAPTTAVAASLPACVPRSAASAEHIPPCAPHASRPCVGTPHHRTWVNRGTPWWASAANSDEKGRKCHKVSTCCQLEQIA